MFLYYIERVLPADLNYYARTFQAKTACVSQAMGRLQETFGTSLISRIWRLRSSLLQITEIMNNLPQLELDTIPMVCEDSHSHTITGDLKENTLYWFGRGKE